MKMEPQSQSILTYEYLKRQYLVTLIRIKLHLGCVTLGTKQLCNVKQIFVRKICKSGYSAKLAFEYIHQLKLYIRSEEVEVDEIVDLEFLIVDS